MSNETIQLVHYWWFFHFFVYTHLDRSFALQMHLRHTQKSAISCKILQNGCQIQQNFFWHLMQFTRENVCFVRKQHLFPLNYQLGYTYMQNDDACNVNTRELQTSLFVKLDKIKNAFYALDATWKDTPCDAYLCVIRICSRRIVMAFIKKCIVCSSLEIGGTLWNNLIK